MLFDVIFRFIVMYVRSLNYISAAINVYHINIINIIFRLIVNTMRKIAVAEAS